MSAPARGDTESFLPLSPSAMCTCNEKVPSADPDLPGASSWTSRPRKIRCRWHCWSHQPVAFSFQLPKLTQSRVEWLGGHPTPRGDSLSLSSVPPAFPQTVLYSWAVRWISWTTLWTLNEPKPPSFYPLSVLLHLPAANHRSQAPLLDKLAFPLLAVWSWMNVLKSDLSVLICKMGIVISLLSHYQDSVRACKLAHAWHMADTHTPVDTLSPSFCFKIEVRTMVPPPPSWHQITSLSDD